MLECLRSRTEFRHTQPSSLAFSIQAQINTRRENGIEGFLGIPFLNALNSGNFPSTTTEKSSSLDQYLGSDVGNLDKYW